MNRRQKKKYELLFEMAASSVSAAADRESHNGQVIRSKKQKAHSKRIGEATMRARRSKNIHLAEKLGESWAEGIDEHLEDAKEPNE